MIDLLNGDSERLNEQSANLLAFNQTEASADALTNKSTEVTGDLQSFDIVSDEILSIQSEKSQLQFTIIYKCTGEAESTGEGDYLNWLTTVAPTVESDFNSYYNLEQQHSEGSSDQFTPREILTTLNIKFGTSDIPRFCCTCHKLNIAVRHAMVDHELGNIIRDLSKANKGVRNSIALNRHFDRLKCRLRCENATRWSSSYLLLESVKRAYIRVAFENETEDLRCPVDEETIDAYLQILKPAYDFLISLQSNKSSICDVVPGVKQLIFIWTHFNVTGTRKVLCFKLIDSLKVKFDYEQNSSVYKVKNENEHLLTIKVIVI